MGFKGDYLFEPHTRAHVRELWQAKLGETGNYDGWKTAGARSTTEKAQEKVSESLAAPAAEFPAELGGRCGEDLRDLLLRLLGRAPGAGGLPAVVVAGLAELGVPKLAHVRAGV